jgi:2-C-methyl-D-erythritol 4-phosphate cytidylyltransferase
MRVGAIVVAAGASRRMGGQDKLWLALGDLPLLGHTLAALATVAEIDQLVVVSSPDGLRRLADLRAREPWCAVDTLVEGGVERPDSVYAGLLALNPCDLVLVHDGARPLVTPELVRLGLAAAREHGAAVPALPVVDTIKTVDAGGYVVATPDRATLRAVQTPQVFRYDLLLEAYEAAGPARSGCTDDAMLLERLGLPVATFPGDPHNIKVSTPADLPLVMLYAHERSRRPSPDMSSPPCHDVTGELSS